MLIRGQLRSLQVCEHYFRKGSAFKWLDVILFHPAAVKIFSNGTAFRLAADVEAARVLCGLNLVANEPQA